MVVVMITLVWLMYKLKCYHDIPLLKSSLENTE
jgi:hypothetical protein